ncbi:UDP-glucose iridoid glucosyltransferase-like [Macadamia integrifolia]|uniref:UDP-glucose iridoid glucosyltransferase-like n=1 Tax=Macadamia integrifolia TaxID=60698 RepID=UPI001C4F3E55|nr:UDP-glucose iridoid glucosyltransferase-like [Macadamia integrifolia]
MSSYTNGGVVVVVDEMEKRERSAGGHLVLLPCPLQGHMNPMLHLANLLHSKGFSITIVHTQFKSPNPSGYPSDINFKSIPDGLSKDQEDDLVSLLLNLNLNCEAPVRDFLLQMQSNRSGQEPFLGIIHDASLYFVSAIADDMKLPRFAFKTNNMTFYVGYLLTTQKGCHPIKDEELEEPVFVLPFLKIKDLPEVKSSDLHIQVGKMVDATRTATAVICNTLKQLEQNALPMFQQDLSIPVFLVGPLHKYSISPPTTATDRSCISWLDTQAPSSVIYISFGSLVTISGSELVEMAWGLANSKKNFLWVVRPSSVHNSQWVELLPKEFEELITNGRGRIVKWVPQQEVLAHPAIGGFWTHSGWNSTLESITEGVPMLCSPRFGDQRINARLVSCVWGVGIQIENDGMERGLIEKSIRRVMVDKEGMEMKRRAMDLKEKIEISLNKGGSSYVASEKLKFFIKNG